jgi:hypothetical protein
MLEEIIPKSNANKKIEDENMNKIASKIKYFIDEALKSDSDYFSSKNSGDNKNNKEKEVLKKYLDFIKFLLLFEKIMKNKIKFEANFSIRGLIKRLLKSCDSNILIIHDRESYQNRSKKCKIIKDNKGEMYNQLMKNDLEFKEFEKDGWNNDEEFNKLRDDFNIKLDNYYTIFKVPEDERVKILSANPSTNQITSGGYRKKI